MYYVLRMHTLGRLKRVSVTSSFNPMSVMESRDLENAPCEVRLRFASPGKSTILS